MGRHDVMPPGPPLVVFEAGALDRVGELASARGMRRALLVTDPGIAAAGHVARAQASLEAAGLVVSVFDRVRENPTDSVVAEVVVALMRSEADGLVAVGGGSSIDAARAANLLLTNGGDIDAWWHAGNPDHRTVTAPLLPFIAAPTTAGTGSEMQSHALIAHPTTHRKRAMGDPRALADVALLDPELTLSCPPSVTAVTGIDALAHTLESAVTNRRSADSVALSCAAWEHLRDALPRVLANPSDLSARGSVLCGAALAGAAIERSMLGAAHALANPLTAHFGIVHGHAVGLMLAHVVRYNAADPETATAYAVLAPVPELVASVESALATAGLPETLREAGVTESMLPALAAEAAPQWTAKANPRPVGPTELLEIYRSAY